MNKKAHYLAGYIQAVTKTAQQRGAALPPPPPLPPNIAKIVETVNNVWAPAYRRAHSNGNKKGLLGLAAGLGGGYGLSRLSQRIQSRREEEEPKVAQFKTLGGVGGMANRFKRWRQGQASTPEQDERR